MATTNFVPGTVIAKEWLNDVDDGIYRKLANYIDVTDYGADNTGATDTTAAIQAAIDAAYVTNAFGTYEKVVFFPAGRYSISTTLVVPRGVSLVGEGQESTYIHADGFLSVLPMVSYTNAPNFRVEGIRFEGEEKASGLIATNSYDSTIRRCHFNAMDGYGIKLSEAARTVIDQVNMYYFKDAADIGLLCDGGSSIKVVGSLFVTEAIGVSATTTTSSGLDLIDTSFEGNATDIEWPLGQQRLLVQNCYFEGLVPSPANLFSFGNTGSGAKPDVWIKDCKIAGAGNNAITVGFCNYCVWEGNSPVGVNVAFSSGIDRLWYGRGNNNSGTVTNAAQVFYEDNTAGQVKIGNTNGRTYRTVDASLGGSTANLNVAENAYIKDTHDALSFDRRISGSATIKETLSATAFSSPVPIYPGALAAAAAQQTASGLFAGNGVPSNSYGTNGDYYFRGDGTKAGDTCIYHKEGGSWIALGTA